MFIQGCATAPGTNHAPEWLSPLETGRTTYGCAAKYGNCQARLNMHIWRRALHQRQWQAPPLWCLWDRQTDWGDLCRLQLAPWKLSSLSSSLKESCRLFIFCACCRFFFSRVLPARSGSFFPFKPPAASPPEVVSLDAAPPSIILSASERLLSDGCEGAARQRG